LVTKKRSEGTGSKPKTAARKTATKGAAARPRPPRRETVNEGDELDLDNLRPSPRPTSKVAVKAATKKAPARPKLRASHSVRETRDDGPRARKTAARPKTGMPERKAAATPAVKKTPLAAPKRAVARKPQAGPPPEADAAKDLAIAMAGAGLDKKAMGVEILDVRGRVDYADFLVIMTGRSDRHVHAIATGIEEELSKKKISAISVEGLQAATWVLLDYGDVVAHVFQEESRQLYDIEGLWMDASRVSVPEGGGAKAGGGVSAPRFADAGELGESSDEAPVDED
jgi:ribosome-associated protein